MKIFYLTVILLIINGCKPPEPIINSTETLVMAIDEGSYWDYWGISFSDQSYMLLKDSFNRVDLIYFKPDLENPGYPIKLNINELPEKALIDSTMIFFANYNDHSLDIGIANPDMPFKIIRQIQTDINFDEISTKANQTHSWQSILRTASRAVKIASSVIDSVINKHNYYLPLDPGTGSAIVGDLINILPGSDLDLKYLSNEDADSYNDQIGCPNGSDITCAMQRLSDAQNQAMMFLLYYDKNYNIFLPIKNKLFGFFPDSGLVAYYPFNGDAKDASENDNDGLVFGAKGTTDRFNNINSAYLFDGIGDYILVPHSKELTLTFPFTIQVWINPSSIAINNFNMIISQSIDWGVVYMLGIGASSDCEFIRMGSCAICNYDIKIAPNQWALITETFSEDSTIITYNEDLFTFDQPLDLTCLLNGVSDHFIYIGKDEYGTFLPFSGKLDEIRIYNRQLTYDEIKYIYRNIR